MEKTDPVFVQPSEIREADSIDVLIKILHTAVEICSDPLEQLQSISAYRPLGLSKEAKRPKDHVVAREVHVNFAAAPKIARACL